MGEHFIEFINNRASQRNFDVSSSKSAQKPQYGYSLVQRLEKSGITIDQSTLYPLLRRLEKQELVTSSWDTTESRPRKYYILSDYGNEIFIQLKKEWEKTSQELYILLKGEEDDGTD